MALTKTKVTPVIKRIFTNAKKNYEDKTYLQGVYELNGKFYITDGYRVIRMDKDYGLPHITINPKDVDVVDRLYKKIEAMFTNLKIDKDNELRLPELEDVKPVKKLSEYEVNFYNQDKSLKVNPSYLIDMLEIGMTDAYYNGDAAIYFSGEIEGFLLIIGE